MNYSVIIPTYNRKEVLARALDSVIAQTLEAQEVIVVDDGSTDNTKEFITRNYPQVIFLRQENRGVSAARNYGFQHAKGEWIALLDSDDEWLPRKMEWQCAELKGSNLLVCHTEEIWVRNGVRVNAKKKHKKKRGDIFSDCLSLCAMSPSSIVLHRDLWNEFDGFDENFIVCEDYDLWLRICAQYEVALVEKASIIKYGGHEDQLSRQYFAMDKYRVIAMEKLIKKLPSKEKNKLLLQKLEQKLMILAIGAKKHKNEELLNFCKDRHHLIPNGAL